MKEHIERMREQTANVERLNEKIHGPQPTGPEKGEERRWTIYVCHNCGWIQGEEQPDLSCAQCGEPRSYVETVEVVEDSE